MCGFVSKIDLNEQDGHLKWACCVLVVSAPAGGCTPARYKAERDALYAIRSLNRFRETFVVSVVNDYYRVLQLRDIVTNAQNDYQRRVQSKERLEMESEAGRRPSFEIDQAVQETLRAQANVVAAEVSEGRKIITIPDTSEMKVEIKIHETWIDKIAVGQPAKITVAAFPGKTFTGKVLKKAPLADLDNWLNPDLKAYVTNVGIEGAGDALKTGMTGKAK